MNKFKLIFKILVNKIIKILSKIINEKKKSIFP